ncbi:MAG: hypothetical protein KAX49_03660 [Halanaerobiales bacterium]|nr:hypothetical protein [Halanaerobiales bacterium]
MKHQIICGDCIKELEKIPDQYVDLIFVDPPYNIAKNYGTYKDNLALEEYYDWCEKWLSECVRILKITGSISVMNYPEHLAYFKTFLDKKATFINWITWIRNDNQPYQKKRKFKKNHQDILFYVKDKEKYYFNWRAVARRAIWYKDKRVKDLAGQPDTWADITYVKGNSKEKIKTKNQLPIKLLERIINSTSQENDIIFDCFLGSGTTIIAAERLNRNSIGIEISKDYCKLVYERLKEEIVQTGFEREISKIEKIGF